jgi:hypothetical protein
MYVITIRTLSILRWTVVLAYVVHPVPVVEIVSWERLSTAVLQVVPATSSPAALSITAVAALSFEQSWAGKSVPLNPMQGSAPTRGSLRRAKGALDKEDRKAGGVGTGSDFAVDGGGNTGGLNNFTWICSERESNKWKLQHTIVAEFGK